MEEQTYFESIMEGLQQAVDFENGDTLNARIRVANVPNIEPLAEYSKEGI